MAKKMGKPSLTGLGKDLIGLKSSKPASGDTPQASLQESPLSGKRENTPAKKRKVLSHRIPLDVHQTIDQIYLEFKLERTKKGEEVVEKHYFVEQILRLGLENPDMIKKALLSA